MIVKDTVEEEIRQVFMNGMGLLQINLQIGEQYLDMNFEEEPELLEKVIAQNLKKYFFHGRVHYLEWLRKKKRNEELARYVRFIVAVGGSTAWKVLLENESDFKILDTLLSLNVGEHGVEQNMAVKAGFCAQCSKEIKKLSQSGKDDPEVFLRAFVYCRDSEGDAATGKISHAKMLLAAMYLHWIPAGAAPDITTYLEKSMIASLTEVMAFEPGELSELRNYAKTAGKDSVFPQKILSIYSQRKGSGKSGFLATCAFLALEHSIRFEIMLRLMVAVDYRFSGENAALDACRQSVEEDWFQIHMEEIEEMLPIEEDKYIRWGLHTGCKEVVARMAVKRPNIVKAAADMLVSEQYKDLMEIVQDANPALYEEMKTSYQKMLCNKIVQEMLNRYYSGKLEAKKFLMGECSAETLIPFVENWKYYYPDKEYYRKIECLKEIGEVSIYRRALIIEALKNETWYFELFQVSLGTNDAESPKEVSASAANDNLLYRREQIERILRLTEEEGLSIQMQTGIFGGLCENVENKKRKTELLLLCVEVFWEKLRNQKNDWFHDMKEAVLEGNYAVRIFCFRVLEKFGCGQFKEIFLSCAGDDSKYVRKLLLEICVKNREWEPEILALLKDKKPKIREFAILVLEEWGQPSYLEEVNKALEREKNKKLMGLLQELAEELKAEEDGNSSANSGRKEERLAVSIFKGARKRKVEWAEQEPFPEVHRKDGEVVSAEYMLAILAAYADMEMCGINQDAAKLAAPLKQEELAAYMHTLYDAWLNGGAEAKKRWVLYVASIHGGAALIPVLYHQIKEWAEHSRGAIAAEAVKALALNGSSEALVLVDQMSRKFKFRQIKNAAGEALAYAASALGIDRETLEDRLVPDMGFEEDMQRTFDYGSRQFTVRLTSTLEPEIYDHTGKRLKNLPSPGKLDDAEKANQAADAFKQMKKQLKIVVQTQKLRLEQALSMARFWKITDWKRLFVNNPIMHQFAIGLIWGTYEGDILKETFRYMEDGSFNTVDEEEYSLPENSSETLQIGLVHPLELSKDILSAWQSQLTDYEIIQPFEQINRPVYEALEEEGNLPVCARFDGKELNGLSLSGKLLKAGWYRGEVLDGGFFQNYYHNDGNMGAELTFSGTSIGIENDDVTIYKLYFYRMNNVTQYAPKDVIFAEENKCSIKDVNPRYYSEIVLQIASVVEC